MTEDQDVEQARKKRLEARKAQEQLKAALRMALDDAAYTRLMNIAVANEELYLAAAQNIVMYAKRLERKITESELVSLLRAIKDQNDKKTTITFHKK